MKNTNKRLNESNNESHKNKSRKTLESDKKEESEEEIKRLRNELALANKEKDEVFREAEHDRRLSFIVKIDNNSIKTRADLMKVIEEAKFTSDNVLKDKVVCTGEYISDCTSIYTTSPHINMSTFKRSQVAETEDKMDVRFLDLPLRKLSEKYLSDKRLDATKILSEEEEIVKKIRNSLTWLNSSGVIVSEVNLQKIFIIYCTGLLHRICEEEVYSILGIDISGRIKVLNTKNEPFDILLSGKSDIAIGKRDMFPLDESSLLEDENFIIGEMKRCYDSLYSCKSRIGQSTNQLLAEMLGLFKRRQEKKSQCNSNFMKSFISDFFYFRIAFRLIIDGKTYYPISSMYETASELVLSIIVLISGITSENIAGYMNQSSIIEDDGDEETKINFEEGNGDDNENFNGNRSPFFGRLRSENTNKQINKNTNSVNYGSKRKPLHAINNIILMAEDHRIEEKQLNIQKLKEWEAARFGHLYLNSHNLMNRL
jgi:hypothetical protein